MKPVFFVFWILLSINALSLVAEQPNVILIMTDDQGYGDFGFTGNQDIATPNLDGLASESARFDRFYVCPVCSPTRACLMTGRYNYRTRAIDTYAGRSMMDPSEKTIAEQLGEAGYATGIFGKWHLGDNYPLRPIDQGFDVSVVHRGGGIGQSSDPLGAESKYTDPILFVNGRASAFKGYCSDIYYEQAKRFIGKSVLEQKPFFVYLPDNCPHGPFKDVPLDWFAKYQQTEISGVEAKEQQKTRQIFSMISNIDENIGSLRNYLSQLGVADNTIIIFLTDNGPNGKRFNAGLRGQKTSVFEGGIRTPLLFHWPAKIQTPSRINSLHAHIDVLPTILEACGVEAGDNLDGRSFLPAISDSEHPFPPRTLFVQSHRGNKPTRFHHFAAIEHKWKLVHPSGFHKEQFDGEPELQLYDLEKDPGEKIEVSDSNPEIVKRLKAAYNEWFDDVSSERSENYAAPDILIDHQAEPVLVLTRQDLRAPEGQKPFHKDSAWQLASDIQRRVNIELIFKGNPISQQARIRIGKRSISVPYDYKNQKADIDEVLIPASQFQIQAFIVLPGGKRQLAHQVVIRPAKE